MNIMGLGETIVDGLVKAGFLRSYADIYRLKDHREELIEAGIIGKEKNTDKILAAIEKSKGNDPVRLLTALGIRNVGKSTAREIMKHYKNLKDVMHAEADELTAIPDIGLTTAECITAFFRNHANEAVLQSLEESGVNMEMPDNAEAETLKGLTFVITGTLPTLGRKEAEELIVKNGGKCAGSVSRKTDYVVAGEAAGSKLDKAIQLNIKVIDEKQLQIMLLPHRQ